MSTRAFVNGRVPLDGRLVDDRTVVVAGGRIQAVDVGAPPSGVIIDDLAGDLLLPGFIDVQVNGGGGILFNDSPSVESIADIARAHRQFGTTGFLPTLISDRLSVVERGIRAVADAIAGNVPGVLGIHIEGPFVSESRRGVHDRRKLRHLTHDLLNEIRPLENGKTVLTVAPESVDDGVIRTLTDRGFIVCLGHSDATYEETRSALNDGARGFTHLFNAMSQLGVRAPGMVGAALDGDDAWCGIIADGHHVDPVALRVAYRCKPRDKLMLVSDAMPPVGSDITTFSLLDRSVSVHDGVCKDQNGTLAGTALDMATALRNFMRFTGIDLIRALPLATESPARFLGVDDRLGHVRAGSTANLIVTDSELNVRRSYIGGEAID